MNIKQKGKTYIYQGTELVVYIPHRYIRHGVLYNSNGILTTLAIFDYVDDGKAGGCLLPATINMKPSSIEVAQFNGERCDKLTFHKGDIVILDHTVVKNGDNAYIVFYEMIDSGKYPKFLDDKRICDIIPIIKSVTGVSFPIKRSLFEALIAFLTRTPNDLSVEVRHTDEKCTPLVLPMRAAVHATKTVTSKLIGSHLEDAITAALVSTVNENNAIEDKLRS